MLVIHRRRSAKVLRTPSFNARSGGSITNNRRTASWSDAGPPAGWRTGNRLGHGCCRPTGLDSRHVWPYPLIGVGVGVLRLLPGFLRFPLLLVGVWSRPVITRPASPTFGIPIRIQGLRRDRVDRRLHVRHLHLDARRCAPT